MATESYNVEQSIQQAKNELEALKHTTQQFLDNIPHTADDFDELEQEIALRQLAICSHELELFIATNEEELQKQKAFLEKNLLDPQQQSFRTLRKKITEELTLENQKYENLSFLVKLPGAISRDKTKITTRVAELDAKMKEALQRQHQLVDSYNRYKKLALSQLELLQNNQDKIVTDRVIVEEIIPVTLSEVQVPDQLVSVITPETAASTIETSISITPPPLHETPVSVSPVVTEPDAEAIAAAKEKEAKRIAAEREELRRQALLNAEISKASTLLVHIKETEQQLHQFLEQTYPPALSEGPTLEAFRQTANSFLTEASTFTLRPTAVVTLETQFTQTHQHIIEKIDTAIADAKAKEAKRIIEEQEEQQRQALLKDEMLRANKMLNAAKEVEQKLQDCLQKAYPPTLSEEPTLEEFKKTANALRTEAGTFTTRNADVVAIETEFLRTQQRIINTADKAIIDAKDKEAKRIAAEQEEQRREAMTQDEISRASKMLSALKEIEQTLQNLLQQDYPPALSAQQTLEQYIQNANKIQMEHEVFIIRPKAVVNIETELGLINKRITETVNKAIADAKDKEEKRIAAEQEQLRQKMIQEEITRARTKLNRLKDIATQLYALIQKDYPPALSAEPTLVQFKQAANAIKAETDAFTIHPQEVINIEAEFSLTYQRILDIADKAVADAKDKEAKRIAEEQEQLRQKMIQEEITRARTKLNRLKDIATQLYALIQKDYPPALSAEPTLVQFKQAANAINAETDIFTIHPQEVINIEAEFSLTYQRILDIADKAVADAKDKEAKRIAEEQEERRRQALAQDETNRSTKMFDGIKEVEKNLQAYLQQAYPPSLSEQASLEEFKRTAATLRADAGAFTIRPPVVVSNETEFSLIHNRINETIERALLDARKKEEQEREARAEKLRQEIAAEKRRLEALKAHAQELFEQLQSLESSINGLLQEYPPNMKEGSAVRTLLQQVQDLKEDVLGIKNGDTETTGIVAQSIQLITHLTNTVTAFTINDLVQSLLIETELDKAQALFDQITIAFEQAPPQAQNKKIKILLNEIITMAAPADLLQLAKNTMDKLIQQAIARQRLQEVEASLVNHSLHALEPHFSAELANLSLITQFKQAIRASMAKGLLKAKTLLLSKFPRLKRFEKQTVSTPEIAPNFILANHYMVFALNIYHGNFFHLKQYKKLHDAFKKEISNYDEIMASLTLLTESQKHIINEQYEKKRLELIADPSYRWDEIARVIANTCSFTAMEMLQSAENMIKNLQFSYYKKQLEAILPNIIDLNTKFSIDSHIENFLRLQVSWQHSLVLATKFLKTIPHEARDYSPENNGVVEASLHQQLNNAITTIDNLVVSFKEKVQQLIDIPFEASFEEIIKIAAKPFVSAEDVNLTELLYAKAQAICDKYNPSQLVSTDILQRFANDLTSNRNKINARFAKQNHNWDIALKTVTMLHDRGTKLAPEAEAVRSVYRNINHYCLILEQHALPQLKKYQDLRHELDLGLRLLDTHLSQVKKTALLDIERQLFIMMKQHQTLKQRLTNPREIIFHAKSAQKLSKDLSGCLERIIDNKLLPDNEKIRLHESITAEIQSLNATVASASQAINKKSMKDKLLDIMSQRFMYGKDSDHSESETEADPSAITHLSRYVIEDRIKHLRERCQRLARKIEHPQKLAFYAEKVQQLVNDLLDCKQTIEKSNLESYVKKMAFSFLNPEIEKFSKVNQSHSYKVSSSYVKQERTMDSATNE